MPTRSAPALYVDAKLWHRSEQCHSCPCKVLRPCFSHLCTLPLPCAVIWMGITANLPLCAGPLAVTTLPWPQTCTARVPLVSPLRTRCQTRHEHSRRVITVWVLLTTLEHGLQTLARQVESMSVSL